MDYDFYEDEIIEDILMCIDILSSGVVLYSTNEKRAIFFKMFKDKTIKVKDGNASYSITTDEFIKLFDKHKFKIYDSKKDELVDPLKDEEYYNFKHK